MSQSTFAKMLADFKLAQSNVRELGWKLAQEALTTYSKGHNPDQLNQLLEAFDKNTVRRSAFTQWVVAHSNLMIEQRAFARNKSSDYDTAANLEKALAQPFWEFAPAKDELSYTGEELIGAVMKVIKRFEKASPIGDAAATLADVKQTVQKFKPSKSNVVDTDKEAATAS